MQRSRAIIKIALKEVSLDQEDVDAALSGAGLTREALEGCLCYYVDDGGDTMVVEFNRTRPRSTVPGEPLRVGLEPSSMVEGRALVARYKISG